MIDFGFPRNADSIDSYFSDKLEDRRDNLIEQLLSKNLSENVCARCFPMKTKTEKFLLGLENDLKNRKNIKIDSESCMISVKGEEGTRVLFASTYWTIAYYDCFFNLSGSVTRYIFFEIYFEEHIFSVLMKRSYYNANNNGFIQFDMDKNEFAMAKKQMEFWQKIIRLEPYTYAPISVNAKDLICLYDDVKSMKHRNKKIWAGYKYTKEPDILLYLMAYTSLVNLIPLLNSDLIPKFMINIVCSNKNQAEEILPALRQIISIFCFNKKIKDIPVVEDYNKENDVQLTTDNRKVFILSYIHEKQLGYCINKFEEHLLYGKDGYPINQIPICIGPLYFAESCVFNIKLDKGLDLPRFEEEHAKCIKKMVIAGFSKLFNAQKYKKYLKSDEYNLLNEDECKLTFFRDSLCKDLRHKKSSLMKQFNKSSSNLTDEYYLLFSCLELLYGNFNEELSREELAARKRINAYHSPVFNRNDTEDDDLDNDISEEEASVENTPEEEISTENILYDKLASIDRELCNRNVKFKKLYEELIAMKSSTQIRPSSKAEFDDLCYPILDTPKDILALCFPKKLFNEKVKKAFNDSVVPKEFQRYLISQDSLVLNNPSKSNPNPTDCTISFNDRSTARVIAIKLNKG